MRHRCRFLWLVLLAATARAAPPPSAADAPSPIVGAWQFALPSFCSEVHEYRADGTETVTSGEQVAQGVYEISTAPSPKGFYRLDERIGSDNGKTACSRGLRVGEVSTNFVLVHASGTMIILCQDESLDACVGPLTRIRDPG
jgi:hypothetical protein